MSEKDVLVVGAGPSGLMMALELARFGLGVCIIDERLKKEDLSKAIGVQVRSLEIFSFLGLYKELIKESHDINTLSITADTLKEKHISLKDIKSKRPLIIEQWHTENVLITALKKKGIMIKRGVKLIDFSQEEDCIHAVLQQNGEQKQEEFSYIIGADGAHSLVRKKISTNFKGKRYPESFILADAIVEGFLDHESVHVYFKKEGFLGFIPMKGHNHYRILTVERNIDNTAAVSIDQIEARIKKVMPFIVDIKTHSWISRFYISCFMANRFFYKRAILIGDAAHIHSPAGAQGMNTGLQDAFNLAFKLALIIKGKAHKSVLASYEQERMPVAYFLLKNTDRLFRLMVRSSFLIRVLRRILIPFLFRFKELRNKLFRVISQIDIRYEKGLICKCNRHIKHKELKLGKRVANFYIIDDKNQNKPVYSYMKDERFLVLIINSSRYKKVSDAFMTTFKDAIRVIHTQVNEYELNTEKIMVIRPDHHLFCYSHLDNYLNTILHLKKFLLVSKNANSNQT